MQEKDKKQKAEGISRFVIGNRLIKNTTSEFWRMNYFPPKRTVDYSMKILRIGQDSGNRTIHLGITDAFRMTFVATTGSGKTMSMRRIISVAHKAGYAILIAPDPKNEFFTNNKPIQAKFHNHLATNEKPEAIPTVVYRPTFFKDVDKRLPNGNKWISFDLSEFIRQDFYTLVNYESLHDNQKRECDRLWTYLEKKTPTGFGDVDDACKELGLGTLWKKLKHLENKRLFDSRFKADIVQDLKDGKVVALNYNGFESFTTDDFGIDQVFLAIQLRKVREARNRKEIPPLIIINDESPRWIPREGNPVTKEVILDSVKVDRRKNISWIFAEQNYNDIDERVINQSKWIFVGRGVDDVTLRDVLKRIGLVQHIGRDRDYRMLEGIKKEMRRLDWSWLMIERFRKTHNVFRFYSPLCAHRLTS